MVRDHTKAGDQLKQLAQGEGLSLPTQASAADTKEESKLSAESGAAFDKDYIRAQRTAHRQAVALFTQESKNGKDANLKSFAAQTLPTLQDHYRMITAMPTSEHGSTMSSAH
jgi:putative membrane protein